MRFPSLIETLSLKTKLDKHRKYFEIAGTFLQQKINKNFC